MGIDTLVIKKEKDLPIQKNIGRIFRKYNIIDYKSPTDYLSVNDFYKVYAYTCFYKADTAGINKIPVHELTITLVCFRFPRSLTNHLQEERRFTVEIAEKGIYYIKGDYFPIQIIVTSQLEEQENLWLKNLTNQMDISSDISKLIKDYEKHKDNTWYQSVMDLIISANNKIFQEAKKWVYVMR